MKTSINKPEIFKYAIALTARAGKAGGNYPDIAATEDNEGVLDLYLTAAVNEAEGELRRKIKDSNDINMTSSGNEIIIEFKNFIRMDEGITDMIRTAMRLYASHYLAAAWLEPTTAKELCEGYRTSAAGYLNKIASALNQRSEFIVPEADYGQRNNNDYELQQSQSGNADYGQRNNNDYELQQSQSGNADYGQRNNNDYELQQSQSGNADYGQRNRDNLYTGIGCTGMDVLTTENPSGPDVILRDRYNNPLIYKP